MKRFKVATFCEPGRRYVVCYTLWYNPAWPRCIEYEVDAENGAEAKKKARALRKAHEISSSNASTQQ